MAGELGLGLTAPQESGSLQGRAEINWSNPDDPGDDDTERVQELLSRRWLVEQAVARLMRRGLRQARYVGPAKVRTQALAAALVTNLVRWRNLMTGDPAPSLAWSPA